MRWNRKKISHFSRFLGLSRVRSTSAAHWWWSQESLQRTHFTIQDTRERRLRKTSSAISVIFSLSRFFPIYLVQIADKVENCILRAFTSARNYQIYLKTCCWAGRDDERDEIRWEIQNSILSTPARGAMSWSSNAIKAWLVTLTKLCNEISCRKFKKSQKAERRNLKIKFRRRNLRALFIAMIKKNVKKEYSKTRKLYIRAESGREWERNNKNTIRGILVCFVRPK